jgi:hypothetical protein
LGRGSDSSKPKILFNVDTAQCVDNKLIIKLGAYATESNPSRHSRVLLNGEQIGKVNINFGEKNPRDFSFDIPSGLVKQGEANVLTFHIENPVVRKKLDSGNDGRLRGLRFYSMVFKWC